jgi:DNA-directed RNA polymerase subunit K/omega
MSKKPEYDENSDMESDVENMNSDDDDDDPKPKKAVKKVAIDEEYGSGDDDDDDNSISDDIEDIENQSDVEEDDNRYNFPSSTASDVNVRRKIIGDEDEDEDEDEDDDYDENYLQKFDEMLKNNVIQEHHPELVSHNYEEVEALCRVVRDEHGIIMDPLHKTMPFITKYEKTKLLGERAKQINAGAQTTVKVDENIIDGYLIALKEYEQKLIPMIIRRPLPNGGCEYWRMADLELIV